MNQQYGISAGGKVASSNKVTKPSDAREVELDLCHLEGYQRDTRGLISELASRLEPLLSSRLDTKDSCGSLEPEAPSRISGQLRDMGRFERGNADAIRDLIDRLTI